MQIGIDLGGSKIEAAVVDGRGDVTVRRRVPLPATYRGVLVCIADLVADLEATAGAARSVGIGTPGATSPVDRTLRGAENTPLDGRQFAVDVSAALERDVRVANDARCFALSEATDGAAASARVVFGVILGTGVGGGWVIDGRIVDGARGLAGEWAHNPLPWPDRGDLPAPSCYCGRSGCVEAYLSGAGLARDHRLATGHELSAREINERARAGDAGSAASIVRYIDRLARALASVINLLDPDVIVVGGGLSGIADLYTGVPRRWGMYVAGDEPRTRLVPARFGDASGVRGAAWLGGQSATDLR